ncbi:Putative permease PerM [Candidatus Providencia siddallii]|uniref:Putative permease PerM n=1 Tax=Candidatus Providencia siddallii TaxID=1715285 RepID=A0A0M6WA86_9GAMM|nr:Putative permease PerM [Candidatus Providencia siddallii]
MMELFIRWYQRRFSDPGAVALFVLLIITFAIIFFLNKILTPLFIAIALAFLLELPIQLFMRLGLSRIFSIIIILVLFAGISSMIVLIIVPTAWQQGIRFVDDLPDIINYFIRFTQKLFNKYPALADAGIIDIICNNLRNRLSLITDSLLTASVTSLISIFSSAIYFILVPLMTFFLLKDKKYFSKSCLMFLPKNRFLIKKVWIEMNQQIINYLYGKFIEIIIVGVLTYMCFIYFKLNYAVLLSVLVGMSVLIPYVGTFIATIPVIIVALFEYNVNSDFWSLMFVYLIIQAIDSNVIVPLLFSEIVNLHPLVIILSIVIFGGLCGFWGVFFAIPLAVLIKIIINIWPEKTISKVLK